CPTNAPTWFVDGRSRVTEVDIGPHYEAVVVAWTRIEEASRFEQAPTNLPSKHRPKQVTAWIGGRRTVRPDVADPVEYTAQWQMWWDSLQPAWRRRESDGTWSTTGGYGEGGREWGPLYQWGVNGILSLVASLYFWGCAIYEQVELRTQWEQAISDVVWMLEGMATYYEKFGKKF
ncbi:hypothetical protein B0H14DRAFT_2415488, partial [Mycena olivaceomarginata]